MSRTIADVARYRSNEGLVGRAVELDALLGLLASEHLYVAYVHGVAGIGKSSLLAAFAARARRAGTMVVALDSRALEPTDRGFCAALGRALGVRSGSPKRLVERLGELGPRTVLVLDHYEVLRLGAIRRGAPGRAGGPRSRSGCDGVLPARQRSGAPP